MSKTRFAAEGTKGFFRNGFRSLASVVILGSSLLLIGIFSTLMIVINTSVAAIDDFNKIVVYLKLDTDKETVAQCVETVSGITNVTGVTYISKQEALASEKEKFGDEYSYVFDSYDDSTNPLPDTLEIEYASVDDIGAIIYNVEQIPAVDKIKNRYDIAKNIQNFKNALKLGGMWLMILLVAVSLFVISNTIRLTYHAREKEIGVMRYIGATKRYITMPFLFEGLLVGLFAGVLGYLIQYYLYCFPLASLAEKFGGYIIVPPYEQLNPYFLLIYFAAGIVLGVLGSAFAIRKYMKR